MYKKYFPWLSEEQLGKLVRLAALYREWNSKVNLISRKDEENLEVHHILHSLAIAGIFEFEPGTKIMDAGTVGGLPGLPLAIVFPEVEFTLVDSIAKKILVVEEIRKELGLQNVIPVRMRFEEMEGSFDFITGRAVTGLGEFYRDVRKRVAGPAKHTFPNGVIYLTGGDLGAELGKLKNHSILYGIADLFPEPYFETKKVVYLYE